jgi:hypothetical protein
MAGPSFRRRQGRHVAVVCGNGAAVSNVGDGWAVLVENGGAVICGDGRDCGIALGGNGARDRHL